MNKLTVVCKFK